MSDGNVNVDPAAAPVEGAAALANPFMAHGVDPDFAKIWSEVYGDEDEAGAGEESGEAEAGAAGDAAPAPAGEGAGEPAAGAGAPAGGTDPEAGAGAPGGDGQPAAPGAGEPAAAGAPEAGQAGQPGAPAPGVAGQYDATAIIPQFGLAQEQISQRFTESFRAAALEELQSKIDPSMLEALQTHPYLLAGRTVPNPIAGQPDIKLRDSSEARDWQEATAQVFQKQAESMVAAREKDIQPIMGVIQDSIMLFQNNPDLIPNTKQYDKELADQVMEIGKAYEYRVGDKLIGYHTNMQPIINSIRATLAKGRPAGAAAATARTEQQRQQAAGQPRTEGGQFTVDGPQAGITSKAGMNGEEGEDYSTYIAAMGLPSNLFI